MPAHAAFPSSRRKAGSALVVAIILAFALAMVVASLLRTLVLDKRINAGIALAGEARNAAEGAAEVAAAELNRRAGSYSSMDSTALNGFVFPSDVRTFLASGHVVSSSIEYKAGNLSPLPERPVVIDGSDPFNALEVDKGKAVIIRHGYIYGRASAQDPVTGRLVTSHISNLVQIREQTWLNYAVFYNLDMEMHSGSTMEIHGPVHTNQNAYLTAGAGEDLEFYGSFTTAKKVYRKYKYGGVVTHTGDVLFTPVDNPSASQLLTMSTTQDSTKSGFKSFAEGRWHGFVQDNSFEVPTIDPPDLPQYVPDDYTTTANEMRNSAYAMVEPQLANVSVDDAASNTYSGYKGDTVENLKFSALAGITIRVKSASTWTTPATATTPPAGYELVYYTGTDPSRPVNRSNLPLRSPNKRPVETVVDLTKMSDALLTKLNAAVKLVKYDETGTGSAGNRTLLATDVDPTSGTDNRYGIYDRRQGYNETTTNNGLKGAHHTVQIDMARFKDFLNAPEAEWTDKTNSALKVYDPNVSYSGIIYVQFPLIPDSDSAVSARKSTDKIRPAVAPTTTAAGFGVVLRNASVLPTLPSDHNRRDDGLTFATNGPVYILGNYNADGNQSTGSASDPDTTSPAPPANPEVPALIAADAVTLLSSVYNDTDMRESAKSTLNTAAFTEIATAIITGIVPTKLNSSGAGTNNQWAGGVHNFVRFLENWTGKTYRYRGSIVSLFESEVSKGPWFQSEYTYWYQFPTRDVGYHVYFSGGRFPPGLPVLRTVRRIAVADISAATYNAGPPTPPIAATD